MREGDKVPDTLDHSKLAELTAEIVSAYVSNNQIAVSDVSSVITSVAENLGALAIEPPEAAPAKPEPAVPIRRSVSRDQITCLVCGGKHKVLKRHLAVAHQLNPADYRELFGLKRDYPMAAPSYVQERAEIAKRIGLGRPRKAATAKRPRAGKGAQSPASD
jgi:MucR family transcriptional regulator, transcriptional regulator of exopolysaccharide biosynthesis